MRLTVRGLPPHVALRSAQLSRRHGGRITASWGSRIDRHPTARLELDGQLVLGHWPSGPPSAAPALVQLHEGAVLRMRGWAVIGGGAVVVVGPGAVLDLQGSDDGSEGVIVSTGARIVCMQQITLGAGTGLSWDSQVLDTDQHHIVGGDDDGELRPHTLPVHLRERVMVGSRASVLKGVTVGADTVIGTGAVVTRDVGPGCVVTGNPACVVREGVRWY